MEFGTWVNILFNLICVVAVFYAVRSLLDLWSFLAFTPFMIGSVLWPVVHYLAVTSVFPYREDYQMLGLDRPEVWWDNSFFKFAVLAALFGCGVWITIWRRRSRHY